MARLITLDEALYATHKEVFWTKSERAAVRSFLVKQPKVDAVPVVRCRDCKHFGGHGICFYHAADVDGTPIFVREDDFCSYGERKDND